jgi:MoaA/NifB/PqqE/SkfB family radical SAM enzyme
MSWTDNVRAYQAGRTLARPDDRFRRGFDADRTSEGEKCAAIRSGRNEGCRLSGGKMDQRIVTKRVVLHVGYACNLRCQFCYYIEDLERGQTEDWSTEKLKRRLRLARRLGKTAVDLTGGEPSIRPDIFELIAYAKSIGYADINMITNGLKLSKASFCEELVKAGLNDVLFSLHSPDADEHDLLTRVRGSHRRLMRAMDNMRDVGVRGRVNTVVSNINYERTEQLLELLVPYSPAAVNLIVFNPSETTRACTEADATRIEDYWAISTVIGSALDRYKDEFPTVNVRFLPFCLLPGHEDVIRTQWQKMYEDQEWDPFLNISFQKGYWQAFGAFAAGMFLYPGFAPKFGKRDAYTLFNEVITTFRIKLYYRQLEPCRGCALRKICTGLPEDYVKRFNKTELEPYVMDTVIDDPLHFCRNNAESFESLRS